MPIEANAARIRLLFLALILWMPLQYFFTAKYGEFYPALKMPSFGGTLTLPNGDIRIVNVSCKVLFRDGEATSISASDLLSPVPSSFRNSIMAHMFGPVPAKSPTRLPSRITQIKHRLFPGRSFSRYQHERKKVDPQTKDWLQHRMEALFPSRVASKVTFAWYAEIFDLKHSRPIITRHPLGLREVALR